ncbi:MULTISPECIES: DUF397 domain-containing protein [unclassified Streptomyces]|uniref:DUF397 domain-containing protein n=1 Tax=unclassified Streptomyces TaxID=2593676 RepID=UPI002E0D3324|nr:DUF397 domain-containing protein [Streptomyces sp. NBC_01296]WSW61166.1 DUF397 domain-containing protein [Streptomyces sp. NBC_00998]
MRVRPVRHSHPTTLPGRSPPAPRRPSTRPCHRRPRPPRVHVRDSKVPHGPSLALTPTAWSQLTHWLSG